MKLQYVGKSFTEGLTDGKIYEGKDVNVFCVAVMDDTGMERIYSRLRIFLWLLLKLGLPSPLLGQILRFKERTIKNREFFVKNDILP